MLTWLLSLAGLGSIGAALAFIPGALPAALLWGRAALAWALTNPAWVIAALALLWGAYESHDAAHAHKDAAGWKTAFESMSAAHLTDLASIAELKQDIARQNRAVMDVAKASNTRQQAAQAALRSAKAAGRSAEAAAARIDAQAPAVGCKSGDAVMAARANL